MDFVRVVVDFVKAVIDFALHLDVHLGEAIQRYGTQTYALLFLIVFLETGVVVTPILPGDSLLFAAGSFAGLGALRLWPVFAVCCAAAILGDTANYAIGAYLGPKVFHYPKSRFFNPEHLRKTHEFYERYGGKTIIIARFLPIIRTFAPVVAGIGKMEYRRFLSFNIFGGIGWVFSMTMLGFSLGTIYPGITKQIDKVIIVVIFVSLMPGMISWLANRKKSSSKPTVAT